MTFRCRSSWALVALGLVLAACGAAKPNRLDLTTPGVHTGAPLPPTPVPTAVPDITPEATPGVVTPRRKPVTRAERRVIEGWADDLRHGRVTAAARHFAVPAAVVNLGPSAAVLRSRDAVKAFNRALPCGAKLVRTRRGANGFVVAVFRLTERPGGDCGAGTGQLAAVAFLIKNNRIARWVRVDDGFGSVPDEPPVPGATASPSETATPEPADEDGMPNST